MRDTLVNSILKELEDIFFEIEMREEANKGKYETNLLKVKATKLLKRLEQK